MYASNMYCQSAEKKGAERPVHNYKLGEGRAVKGVVRHRLASALVCPVQVLGGRNFATVLAVVHHVEVLAVGALNVKFDGLGTAEILATNSTGIVRSHIVGNEFLQFSKRH